MGLCRTRILAIGFLLSWSQISEGKWAPNYHFAPEKGWMNDPNGLSYYDSYYHAFYQYNPDDTKWGPMHWGHARSKDMLTWEHLPIALTPSLPEDIDGIFSGSAIVNGNNLTLIYTGVSGNYEHQKQCLATSSDGITFDKKGAVIQRDGNDKDFRDPKIWRQDESWFVVIGSKTSVDGTDRGEALLYKSLDLYSWEFQGILAQADEKLGYVWECPDFFTLEGKHILAVNPQGIEQDGYNYQNLHQSGYFVGTWAPGSEYQIEKGFREIDHGHDFYASQTFLAPDGRRILIGWLDMWESVFPESSEGWAGMLSLPRELTLSPSGDLEVRPIREVRDRRYKNSTLELPRDFVLNNRTTLDTYLVSNEVTFNFKLSNTTSEIFGIRIGDTQFSDAGVSVYVNRTESRLFLERYYPAYDISLSYRSIPIKRNADKLDLDIFVDKSSIEIFVNDGEAVLSSRIYPTESERALTFFNSNGTMEIHGFQLWSL